jgi:hypothetical protein
MIFEFAGEVFTREEGCSFAAKGCDRIDPGGPPRGHETGDHRDNSKKQRATGVGQGIERLNFEE